MRNECNVINELLPLYVENMVCEDTIYFIEEHISKCEECRNRLNRMRNLNILDENKRESINNDITNLKNFKKEWKRKNRILIRNRTILIVICIFIAMAILASNCFTKNFTDTQGIHVLGNWAHINYQEKCYFIDTQTKEITGDSTFTISGILFAKPKELFKDYYEMSSFSGHMEVSAYPFAMTEVFHKGSIHDKKISLASGNKTDLSDLKPFYQVHIMCSNPDIVVIYIYLENDEVLVAVCGQSEDEALENYQQYLEEFL